MNAERNRVADLLSKRLQSAKISDAVRTTLKEMRVNASGMKALLQPAKPIFKDEIHQVSIILPSLGVTSFDALIK